MRDCAPGPLFYRMLGQTHVNGWSRVLPLKIDVQLVIFSPLDYGFYDGVATYLIIGKTRKP